MPKFSGKLSVITGYSEHLGIYTPMIKTYPIMGDLLRKSFSNEYGESTNRNMIFANRFSFIAKEDLVNDIVSAQASSVNNQMPIYFEYYGTKFTITDVSIETPRIVFSIRDVWKEDRQ